MQLTNVDISRFVEKLDVHMQKLRIERKSALKFRLSAEEILLHWQEHFGHDTAVSISVKKRFGSFSVSISLRGEECNPFHFESDEKAFELQILNGIGLAPVFVYKRGVNHIHLRLNESKDNSVPALLIAISAAVLIGFFSLRLLPEYIPTLLRDFLLPIRTTLLNIITAAAVPMVFFSVLQGISGADDLASFGKIGKRISLRFIAKIALYTAIVGILMIPIFSIDLFGDGDVTSYSGALQMILNIFPKTIFDPFVNGNALQAIVIAIVFGLAVLLLGPRSDGIKKFTNQCSSAFYIIAGWLSKLAPVLVFVLILETVWSGYAKNLIGLWKPVLITAVACILMLLAEVLTVAIKHRINPVVLIKKLLPSNLLAFSTSCAMATYNLTTEACEKHLGVSKKITKFGLPFGLVAYMPAVSVYYLVVLFYGIEQYNLSCSFEWILIAFITVTLLSVATPPISGGSVACFAVLLSQMSLPAEAIAYALAMNVITERFCAMADLGMLEMEMVLASKDPEHLDREALRREKNPNPKKSKKRSEK